MVKRKQNGFTLVELLLAISLFAILIPTIIMSLNSIAAANDNAKDLAISNIVAENKIEEIRSLGYNSISNGTTNFTSILPETLGAPKNATYTVSDGSTGIKVVTISISFTNRRGAQTLNYKTLVSELGVGQ